jgi:hypothetical protein
MAVGGLKLSYCLEYRLFAEEACAARLPEFGGRGEPDDEGV